MLSPGVLIASVPVAVFNGKLREEQRVILFLETLIFRVVTIAFMADYMNAEKAYINDLPQYIYTHPALCFPPVQLCSTYHSRQ